MKTVIDAQLINLFKKHLNVWWLRPESALFDAILSGQVAPHLSHGVDMDIGCGNGVFTFLTCGGELSPEYDIFIQADPDMLGKGDVYDSFKEGCTKPFITKRPAFKIGFALDHKKNLLSQAKELDFYENTILCDCDGHLPLQDGKLSSLFSNIFYWLDDVYRMFNESARVLRSGGKLVTVLPDPNFKRFCPTYNWQERNNEFLRKINFGRKERQKHYFTYDQIRKICLNTGFEIEHHGMYLCSNFLTFWDIGLRPISDILIKMTHKLAPDDKRAVKEDFIAKSLDYLLPILESEINAEDKDKGFHLIAAQKR